jgi:hypothetical protein
MATLPSGLGAQWCAVDETTYGVAPSLSTAVFVAADSDSLQLKKGPKNGTGIFAGSLAPRGARRRVTTWAAQGALPMDLPMRQLNPWLKRMFGSKNQSGATLTQDASTTAYVAYHSLADLFGQTFTLQAGKPTVDGVTEPFTYTGCKVQAWEVACQLSAIAKLTLTIEGRNELNGTWKDPLNGSVPALQAFTAPVSGAPFCWVDGAVYYGGTPSTAPLIAAPSAPTVTPAASGGTVAAGTYQVVVSYVDSQGETIGSTASPVTTTTGVSTITITSPAAAPYATGWYAYVTQAGALAATATRQQAPGSPTNIGTNLVITAPPTNTGAVWQSVNTAGQLTTVSGATLAGNITGSMSLKVTRPMRLDRYAPNVAPFRNEPIQNGLTQIAGAFTVEWLSAETYQAAYQSDTGVTIEQRFTGPVIGSGTDHAMLGLLCPQVFLEGESPKVPGPDLLTQAVTYTGEDDGVNNILQGTYWTLDSTG